MNTVFVQQYYNSQLCCVVNEGAVLVRSDPRVEVGGGLQQG